MENLKELLPTVLGTAPINDEPTTSEDLAAIQEGFADQARGEVVSHAEVKRRLISAPSLV